MSLYFRNRLRSYPVVISALRAFSTDICKSCIGLEGAQTKVIKGLKKLRKELQESQVSEEEREELLTRIDSLSQEAEGIEIASDCECQKTAGNCKIGPGCFALGALEIVKHVTEPKS